MKLERPYDLLVLVGPTASGKSAVAMELARSFSAEIVAVDAMQVYSGMDIGTGKPSMIDRHEIMHHGIDLVEPQVDFTAAIYRRYALTIIQNLLQRGRLPLLVCGTGLYLRAMLDGLCPAPSADEKIRQTLAAQAAEYGLPQLYQYLKEVDPDVASRVHPNDQRRIIRALEVYEQSGKPLGQWQRQTQGLGSEYQVLQFGILRDRDDLCDRIDERVDMMWESGWREEAQALYRSGVSRTAAQAIGYRQMFEALARNETMDGLKPAIQRETRQYAKRQMTWFKKDPRIHWIPASSFDSAEMVARSVRSFLGH